MTNQKVATKTIARLSGITSNERTELSFDNIIALPSIGQKGIYQLFIILTVFQHHALVKQSLTSMHCLCL